MFAGMEHRVESRTQNGGAEVGGLRKSSLHPDPMRQFGLWFEQVLAANVPEPNAMILATATREGIPSARVVLLKAYDADGFVFFTNYESQKGRELDGNPHLALVFFWPTLERQIRVSGTASRLSYDESERYFHTRPLGSQIGAWASHQSQVLPNRETLDSRFRELTLRFQNQTVPLPPSWGGYRVRPSAIEFWQAGANRLHDRFRYTPSGDGSWKIERLSP
jgi:pyridoxamine 5'-phosphate oxidase